MTNIHKGGRPKTIRPEGFWLRILEEYETMTIKQMSEFHKVSRSTINAWLRQARQIRQEETNVKA